MRKNKIECLVFLFVFVLSTILTPVSAQICSQGKILKPCECGDNTYSSGFCCYNQNANSGVWFDSGYESISGGCPSGKFYFVDKNNPYANDSNPGTEKLPWKTLQKAVDSAEAGDVVLVKEGRYIGRQIGSYRIFSPAHSGTQNHPIIFKSYPLHKAILGLGEGPNLAMKVYVVDYIVIDGFKIEGRISLQGEPNDSCVKDIIRNCDISYGYYPPTDPSLNWGMVLFNTRNCTIERNYVHDLNDSGNHLHNTAYIMIFNSAEGDIIQNNIVEGNGSGVIWSAFGQKGGNINSNIWRYNIAKNVPRGFLGMASTDGQDLSTYNSYYDNLVINCISAFSLDHGAQYFSIHDNTVYNCSYFLGAFWNDNMHNEIWNNVAYGDKRAISWGGYPEPENFSILLDYSDYNCFYKYSVIGFREKSPSLYYYTLQDWRESGKLGKGMNPDLNSIYSDPKFLNSSGTMSEIEDFKLAFDSPCKGTGRNGDDIGADIDLVGIQNSQNENESPICEASPGHRCWYAAPWGNDSNDGSFERPFASIQKGVNYMQPGDYLYLRNGTYTGNLNKKVDFIYYPKYATPDSPTVIKSYPNEKVIIDAQVPQLSDIREPIFQIESVSNMVIDGLDLRNAGAAESGEIDLSYDSPAINITIQNCRIGSGSRGGPTWTTNNPAQIYIHNGALGITIKNCEIYNDKIGQGAGIKLYAPKNVTIKNCEIHHLSAGIANKWGSFDSLGNKFISNYIHDIGPSRGGIWVSSPDTLIENNIIINCLGAGIEVFNAESYQYANRPYINHNTLINNTIGISINNGLSGKSVEYSIIKNNLLYHSNRYSYTINKYFTSGNPDLNYSDYNCFYAENAKDKIISNYDGFYDFDEWKSLSSFDIHSFLINDSPFVNNRGEFLSTKDFEIQSQSPCKNSASDGKDIGADISNVGLKNSFCGNSVVENGEQCDDGNTITEKCPYGQTSCIVCSADCRNVNGETSYCGDGVCTAPYENAGNCPSDCQNTSNCTSQADSNSDGVVSLTELTNYINQWLSITDNSITISQVVEAIKEWKLGCGR